MDENIRKLSLYYFRHGNVAMLIKMVALLMQGHSVTKKLNSDGKVDTLQTLHNLNEGLFLLSFMII